MKLIIRDHAFFSLEIPMKQEELQDCMLLKRMLKTDHLYMVGGSVRDYFFHLENVPNSEYLPKDIDLTTDLSESQIIDRLSVGKMSNVRVHEKESVDTFGVVFVNVDGRDYEIAPFRKDIGTADGRRPERVERASMREDAMRRDLTMNNLYYDFEKKEVFDFNPGAQGIKDIQNKVARVVGEPYERFDEDKLRVLRLIRFFSRFNDGNIVGSLDKRTLNAIKYYKHLPGVTPERIAQEFLSGLKQSKSPVSYLQNYARLGLFERVFPNLHVSALDSIGKFKNSKVVLSWLLKDNKELSQHLNKLKYPNEISDPVAFYVSLMNGMDSVQMIKSRSRWLSKAGGEEQMSRDLQALSQVYANKEFAKLITHLAGLGKIEDDEWKWIVPPYVSPKISGEELMKEGIPQGPELGKEIDKRIKEDYESSYLL